MAVNILLSYAYHKSTNLRELRERMGCGRILIDSGAYTAHTTGRVITLSEYADYLRSYEGAWDHAVTLDVIGDPKKSNVNTRKLHGMGLKVMPVFTTGESLAEFDAMVKDAQYVCVGGGVGMTSKELVSKRAYLLQRRAEEQGGGIHALGIGAIPALRRIKPYSADASNISNAFTYGTIPYFDGRRIPTPSVANTPALRAARQHLLAHDLPLARFLKEKRIFTLATGNKDLAHKFGLSYAAADEYLRKHNRVAPPVGVVDQPGTHLYSALATSWKVWETARLDRDLHDGYSPLIWRRHGGGHECRETSRRAA